MKKKKNVTLQDVAKEAGVSVATVSRAIKKPSVVNEATGKLIHSAIVKTGYVCNFAEPFCKSSVVVIVHPMSNIFFFDEVIMAARSSLESSGYQCVTLPTSDFDIIDTVNEVCDKIHPVGLVFLGQLKKEEYDRLSCAVPIVQCCEFDERIDAPAITINDYFASKLAVEYLIARGKKKIGFMTSSYETPRFVVDRYRGYCDAIREAGIVVDQRYIYKMRNVASYDTAYAIAFNMFRSANVPDAMFVVSDIIGAAFVQAANANNISIPNDFSIIGFDNTMFSRVCSPALTTISQPRTQMGSLSAEMLVERIKNPELASTRVILETEFVIRGTT